MFVTDTVFNRLRCWQPGQKEKSEPPSKESELQLTTLDLKQVSLLLIKIIQELWQTLIFICKSNSRI